MSVRSLLEQTLVKDILKPSNRLITVNSTQQIVEACAVLASNGISAAPVWDAQDHCFKGVLDYRDVSELLLRSFSRRTGADGYGDRLSTDTELAALIRGGIVEGSSASSVADFSRHDPFVAARASDTAWSCIVNYLESGIHRVLVFDDTSQNFIGMLSQSDIITFVLSNRALLDPKWFTTKVMDLELDNSPVSMNWNGTVLDALQLMHDKEVTSLALVDSGGILRSAFSMTDIKYLVKGGHFGLLKQSCREYMGSVRYVQALEERSGNDTYPYFGVHQDDIMSRVVGLLKATHSHRLFIVQDSRPIGIISLTDVLRTIK